MKQKRLLILGGTTLMIHVVKTAKSMGVFTIVTDISETSPAKAFADKAYNISTGDMDKLYDMALNEHIDGVFTGYEDFNTIVAFNLCAKLGLPFYATKEQIELTKNKVNFKNTCRKHNIPVVKEYEVGNVRYPVVTKPADSYSGKGITVCRNREELDKGVEFALSFSKSGEVLIEKFMDSHSTACVNIDYVIRDGVVKLSAVGDKYVNDEQGNKTPLTSAVLYPSKYQNEYIETIDSNVKQMFADLGMRNGTLFIESFYDEEGFHFYEMGYRIGGGQSSILLDKIEGVDYVKMLIDFAITGKMCDDATFDRINPSFDSVACGLVLLIKNGTISTVEGVELITSMDDVVNFTQYYYPGDCMENRLVGTLGQTFARIHIVSPDKKSFVNTIEAIKNNLRVSDMDGNNMLLSIVCNKMDTAINTDIS